MGSSAPAASLRMAKAAPEKEAMMDLNLVIANAPSMGGCLAVVPISYCADKFYCWLTLAVLAKRLRKL